MSGMKLWWSSWNQDGDDCRPVAWPPPEAVLAFWESGFGEDHVTVVALVRAPSAAAARRAIRGAWSPGVGAWRFVDEHDAAHPPGDRFPPPDWSIEMERWPWSVSKRGGQ